MAKFVTEETPLGAYQQTWSFWGEGGLDKVSLASEIKTLQEIILSS